MLIDRVLADLDIPRPSDYTGNGIRGSRLGRCARQSAYMMFPDAYPPSPLPARSRLVFAFGDLVHDLVRREFRRVVPGMFGLEEERFWFRVPLTTKDAKRAQALLLSGALAGKVSNVTPKKKAGLTLALAEPTLYVPLHVDGVVDLGPSLAPVEIKSMATASFQRAVKGKLDYAYRVQMAAAVDATGLDAALYLAVRRDTAHMLEVVYSKKHTDIAVAFTKMAQMPQALNLPVEDGPDWEAAEVRHPFEPHLLDQARDRVRSIIRSTVTSLPEREYGVSFDCATCDGTGTQTKAKNTGEPLKRGPKPCDDCERADVNGIPGMGGPSGKVSRAELGWVCRYCAYISHCYPMAKLEIENERPHYWINRDDYDRSGLTFTSPEAA